MPFCATCQGESEREITPRHKVAKARPEERQLGKEKNQDTTGQRLTAEDAEGTEEPRLRLRNRKNQVKAEVEGQKNQG